MKSVGSEQGATVASSEAPVWLTVREAANRARCGPKVIYRAVDTGKLRAARVTARGDLRFRAAWVDEWLDRSTLPQEHGG